MSTLIKTSLFALVLVSGAASAQAGDSFNDLVRTGSVITTGGILDAR